MSSRPEVMDRAQADLDAGRPWNAANRLQGYLANDPLHVEARLMLGQVLLDMGELEEAGRALLPSERDDDAAREAIAEWLTALDDLTMKRVNLVERQGFANPRLVEQLGPIGRARTEPVCERVHAVLAGEGRASDDRPATVGDRIALGCFSIGCGGLIAIFGAGLVQIWSWVTS